MTNTTLYGGEDSVTITLHDGSNAIIIENDCRKEAILAILPLYLKDSDETDVFDFGGTIKHINITGVYLGADIDALKTWIDSVEGLIQGHQDNKAGYPLVFTDDLRGTLNVKVLDFNSTFSDGTKTKIDWTLKLVHSSTNG